MRRIAGDVKTPQSCPETLKSGLNTKPSWHNL